MSLNIYYVDDEPELCELFEDLFSESGIMIKTFTDPIVAIEKIKIHPPDLLFMDYRMPGLSGLALAEATDMGIKKFLISGENNLKVDYPFVKILSKPLDTIMIRELIQSFKK